MIVSSYQVGRRAVGMAWVFLACLTALTIPAAVAPVFQLPGAQGVPFLVGFLMAWAFVCYQVAVRAIYRLDLSAAELRWHGLLRAGGIPLGELRTIRPRGSAQVVIESAGRKPLRVAVRAGAAEFAVFAADVKEAAPQVHVELPGIPSDQRAEPTAPAPRLPSRASPGDSGHPIPQGPAPPTWLAIIRTTALAGLGGALLEAVVAAGTAQPNPIGVLPGGATAVALLYRRGVGVPAMAVAVVAAVASSGLLWLAFASIHAARWVTVADAVICPLVAIAAARLASLARRHSASGDEQA